MAAAWFSWRKLIKVFGAVLLGLGFAGFVGQSMVAHEIFGPMRNVALPVGRTKAAIELPDGRYAVPLVHVNRVQVYSHDLKFEYGWQVDASGGSFTLLPSSGGNLEIYTARGDFHLVFDAEGRELSRRTYDYKAEPMPQSAPSAVSVYIPWPWWSYPLLHPFKAWGVGAVGMIMLIASRTRAERLEEKRRRERWASRPAGRLGAVVQILWHWIIGCIFAFIGILWLKAAIGALVQMLSRGRILGSLGVLIAVLVGAGIVWLALCIIREALRETVNWFKGTS